MSIWGADDVRIVGDIILGSLLARAVKGIGGRAIDTGRLIIAKAFLEPAAVWAGRRGWRWADRALGDRLPDWIAPEEKS